jgi:hypothetical protein
MRNCTAIKANGQRCRGIATSGSDWCPAHDPARAEERSRAASKAAKSLARTPEITRIKSSLKDLYEDVLEGRVDRSAAAVANQVCNTLLRAIEVERRVREQDELEIRLDELEGHLEDAEERSRYGRW